MKITEEEIEAIRHGLEAAFNEGCLDENVAFPAFDRMVELCKRHQILMDKFFIDYLKYLSRREFNTCFLAHLKREKAKLEKARGTLR